MVRLGQEWLLAVTCRAEVLAGHILTQAVTNALHVLLDLVP